ncbi:hypothetical protein ACO0LD_26630 [Undibacterium sp. Ji83W]|uniref:hypothetical protein n=1 Tax=Undibacterium sp. Ji83W TaxID=3413043 RepID=UPI003BF05AB8
MRLQELYDKSARPPYLDEVLLADVLDNPTSIQTLNEDRKWITGRFERNIGIDQPTHLQSDGQTHAHVMGRRGNELGVVNLNGSPSHGSKFKLHQKDADALRARGFKIRADNIVEWVKQRQMPQIIYG